MRSGQKNIKVVLTATIQKEPNKPKSIYNFDKESNYLKNIEKNLEISQ